MDPSILSTTVVVVGQTARSTQSVAEELQALLLNTRSSQDMIRSLQSDVNSFRDGCNALHSLLNGLASSKTQLAEAQDVQFYTKIQQAMSEYAATIASLGQHIRNMDGSRSGFRRPSWISTKLGAKTDEVVRAKQRIDSHSLSLQMILGILNLRLSLQSLEIVDLAIVRSGIQELQRKRARLQATSQVNSPYLGQDQRLFDTTAALIAEADLVLTLAFSTYEAGMSARSTTSASHTVTMTEQARQERLIFGKTPSVTAQSVNEADIHPAYRGIIINTPPATAQMVPEPLIVQTNFSPSTRDIPTAAETHANHLNSPTVVLPTNSNVSHWIQGLSELDKRQRSSTIASRPLTSTRTASTVDTEVTSGQSIGERLKFDATSLTQISVSQPPGSVGELSKSDDVRQLNTAAAVIDDSDDDDDIEVDLAKNILTIGKAALDEEDYTKARNCLLEGLQLVQQLPSRLQSNACDMLELRYQLATCALALDNQVAVEKALVDVLQQEPSSDAQREKLFHVSHILAQLYIRTARLSLARQTCTNALRGRRKLFGKDYDGYYASLALISRISELENAPLQAQGYMNMIPEEERHKHTFQNLKIEEYCEKEVVVVEDAEPSSRSSAPPISIHAVTARLPPKDRNTNFVRPNSVADVSRQASVRADSLVDTSNSEPVTVLRNSTVAASTNLSPDPRSPVPTAAQDFPQVAPSVEDVVPPPYVPSTIRRIEPDLVSPLVSPSTDIRRSFIDVPVPSPQNDYLGYCKGAWMLQTGNAKAMKKSKEFNYGRSSTTVYNLGCSVSKCEFATEIEYSVIGTWTKVHKTKERIGIAYRWAFLAKSHVQQQVKVPAHQTLFKCLFCIALGTTAPVMQGTDLYLEHVAQEHRGKPLGGVVLDRTRCIDDKICTEQEEFDINLYPRTA